jgi:cell division septation protein DedD
MPVVLRSEWRLPAMIVGTALAALLLGSAGTIWRGKKPLPQIAHAAGSAQAVGAVGTSQKTGLPESARNSAQPPTAQAGPAATISKRPASPASTPATTSAGATQPGSYGLQLGAFLDAAKAKSLADLTTARGYTPIAIDAADGYGRTWHYVRLGAFADQRVAALTASDLLERAGIGSVVIRLSAADEGR